MEDGRKIAACAGPELRPGMGLEPRGMAALTDLSGRRSYRGGRRVSTWIEVIA